MTINKPIIILLQEPRHIMSLQFQANHEAYRS